MSRPVAQFGARNRGLLRKVDIEKGGAAPSTSSMPNCPVHFEAADAAPCYFRLATSLKGFKTALQTHSASLSPDRLISRQLPSTSHYPRQVHEFCPSSAVPLLESPVPGGLWLKVGRVNLYEGLESLIREAKNAWSFFSF
jgi:hypothetical protein